ncbi:MAG: histidine phosphatase family protein, partial [Candidatus Doudnabacteria bacterium]|nr:histidine phosphatase family protein [Candidatus Doudnabacteria bacterium]
GGQVKKRLVSFLDEIKSKHGSDTLVIVTHYGIINMMNSIYTHTEHHKLSNASVHKFKI